MSLRGWAGDDDSVKDYARKLIGVILPPVPARAISGVMDQLSCLWRYLYRAIDSNGNRVEFWFSERRNLAAAKRFLHEAMKRYGRPERIVIDGSQTNYEAIVSCDMTDRLQDRSRRKLKAIKIRQRRYLNNRIEQDHRAVKRRVQSMLGFKSMASARAILGGIEMIHMMRKQQTKYACNRQLYLAEQFDRLVA